ncbi:MAG TPA: hypothetical protein PK788_08275, partial [Gemmatimonadaceae bacterium]|nr:hypothetical protein [Gemmatimonadaceae bacterium]
MRVPHLCIRRAAFALGLLLLVAVPLVAQDEDAARPAPASEPRLRVFLDCPTGGCDRNYLVTNLPFVLWTQDRLDADVHALITGLGTAAGGTEYTIALLGRAAFAGHNLGHTQTAVGLRGLALNRGNA